MYWFPLFYKIFTGFVVKVCQLDVLSKKLPSHDRLTTNEGFEPTHATRIKNLNYSDSYAVITSKLNVIFEPLQAHRDRFI